MYMHMGKNINAFIYLIHFNTFRTSLLLHLYYCCNCIQSSFYCSCDYDEHFKSVPSFTISCSQMYRIVYVYISNGFIGYRMAC